MIAIRCDHCGAPVSVALLDPAPRSCAACGTLSSPPAEVRAELDRAAALVRSLDVRKRQLRASQRRALGATQRAGRVVGILAIALGAPFALMALCLVPVFVWLTVAAHGAGSSDDLPVAVLGGTMVAVLIAVVGAPLAVLRARKQLLIQFTASPPARQGAPATCRVCGGSLGGEQAAELGVERCSFCQADNVVRADALALVARERHVVLTRHQDRVRRSAASPAANPLTAGLLAAGAPLLLIVPGVVIAVAIGWSRKPVIGPPMVSESRDHVLVTGTPGGTCVGSLQDSPDGTVYLSIAPELAAPTTGSPSSTPVARYPGAPVPRFRASALIGRAVRCHAPAATPVRGRVLRLGSVVENGLTSAAVAIEVGREERPCRVDLACVDSPEPDLTHVAWPAR